MMARQSIRIKHFILNSLKDAIASVALFLGIKAARVAKLSDITEVNVNLTDTEVIKEFLKSAGVKTYKIQPFIQSLLAHRKTNEYGISRVMLTDLLVKFGLEDKVKVFKHSFLKKVNE